MTELRDQLQSALGSAYVLERELGGGGMSRVFVAEETALGRKVVVKVLHPDLVAGVNVDRFRREIQVAARLQQAQIVPLLAAGEIDGIPYYSMPFVEGESLRARLDRGGSLSITEVVSILRDVSRALAYAHEHGVVHRDIKPDNVLLSGGSAVVTDFGIAKALAAGRADRGDKDTGALTQLGTSIGTPAYISPEQASGDPNVDHRSDIYSLGCMAYELVTGQPPFSGRTPQKTIVAHLTEQPAPIETLRPETPPALAALVMRCLAKDPESRPQTATEIATALDSAVSTGPHATPSLLAGPHAGMRALFVAVGALAAVAVLAKAAVVGFGLPDWVFSGALILAIVGLGVSVFTEYAHRTSHAVSAHMTWRRAFRGGGIAVGAFAIAVTAIMIMRVFGVGPAASLLAAGTLHGRERLIVIDFNAGKDSSLSHVVTEAVRTNLGQSQVMSIMPPTAIAAALARAQKPASTPLDLALARDIAQREGVKAIVAGDVTQLGTGYVVAIRLVSADSGSELAAYRKTVNGTSELLEAIDDLTRKLRGRIGESLKSVRDAPALDQVTTSSLEALQKYADASRAFDLSGDYVKAAQLLREAVAKDSTFAMAYRKLGVALSNMGMPRPQIDSALRRAYQFRDRLPDKERYLTIATYYSTGPGLNRQKAAEAFQQALNIDTSDMTAAVNLAGQLRSRRQFARAESLYTAINRSSRASQISMGNHAGALVADGKAAEAESVYREMAKRFPAARAAQVYPVIFMYKRGQYDSAEVFWKKERDNPNPIFKIGAVSSLAQYAQLRGRLKEARALSREATALNAARGVPANPLGDSLGSASVAIWYFDEKERGAHALDAALAQVPLRSLPVEQRPYFQFAVYYALAGKTDKARAMIEQFDADVKDTAIRLNSQPARHSVLAEIAMAEKRPLDAVREIWASDSLPDGPVGDCARCADRDLGRAYDLANMPDSAIVHWERYLNEATARGPGVDGGYLAGMYKRLGELYEAKGDTKKAATYYVSFLDLWKSADAELQPKVQDVKRRLAAIQAGEKR